MKDLNLYKVTCAYVILRERQEKDIYVVAEDPAKAEKIAISKINEFEWKYNDYVSNIELIADNFKGKKTLLAIQKY